MALSLLLSLLLRMKRTLLMRTKVDEKKYKMGKESHQVAKETSSKVQFRVVAVDGDWVKQPLIGSNVKLASVCLNVAETGLVVFLYNA